MIKKQSATKGFAILSAASILNKVLSIVYVPLLTAMIGDVGNGIANAGYTIYLLVFQITYMGIPVAISKMVSEQVALGQYRNSMRTLKIAGAMLTGLGFVLMVATALGARWLATLMERPQAYLTVLALSPTVLLASVSATFRGYFQGRRNMVPTSISQIVEQVVNTVCTLAFAAWMLKIGEARGLALGLTGDDIKMYKLQFGAAGSALGTTAGALVSMLYLLLSYARKRKGLRQEIRRERKEHPDHVTLLTGELVRQILHYSAPIILGVIVIYSANFVDVKYTNNRLKYAGFTDAQATGLYGILTTQFQKLINVPLAVANTLAVVLMPSISGTAALDRQNLLRRKIHNGMRGMFTLTIPAAAILAVMGGPVIHLLFPRNTSGADLMAIGAWAIILTAFVQIQTSIIQGMGRMHRPTIHMSIALIVKIIANYILIGIPSINIRGAVVGTLLCYGLAGFLNYRYMLKITGFRTQWFQLLAAPMGASLLMALASWDAYSVLKTLLQVSISSAYLLNMAALLPALLLGAAVYGFSLYMLKGVTLDELGRVPMVGKRLQRNRFLQLFDRK